MILKKNSIKCIYAINVFHHLPNPEKFLDELCRVLKVGGGAILIEPHNGFFSSVLHKYFLSKDEQFITNVKSWKNKKISGPLSGANQALSYIVFERDLGKFKKIYENRLQIVHKTYVLNFLRYIFSGGLNFRQLLPTFFDPLLIFIEILCKPFAKFCSVHHVIVLKRI
jgi:SAM-dependent methyltransferase